MTGALSVLVAEDDTILAEWQKEVILRSPWLPGCEVRCVTSLSETLTACVQQQPDLVVLDMRLRDALGYGTFATFHREFPHIPVLLYSALIDGREGSYLIRDGAAHCAAKPLSTEPEELHEGHFIDAILTAIAQADARRLLVAAISSETPGEKIERAIETLSGRVAVIENRWPLIQEMVKKSEDTIADFRLDFAREMGNLQALISAKHERTRGAFDILGKLVAGLIAIGATIAAWRWK